MTKEKHILIVDDERGLVDFVKSLFEARGFRVSTASNGLEALKKIKKHGNPDLMILDINMPGMGGLEVYTHLCSSYGRTHFPIIVLTVLDTLSEFFNNAFVDAFFSKPFKVSDLLSKSEELLEKNGISGLAFYEPDDKIAAELFKTFQSERFLPERIAGDTLHHDKKYDYIVLRSKRASETAPLVEKIRKDKQFDAVPILVYSRGGDETDLDFLLNLGADRVITNCGSMTDIFMSLRQAAIACIEKRSDAHEAQ